MAHWHSETFSDLWKRSIMQSIKRGEFDMKPRRGTPMKKKPKKKPETKNGKLLKKELKVLNAKLKDGNLNRVMKMLPDKVSLRQRVEDLEDTVARYGGWIAGIASDVKMMQFTHNELFPPSPPPGSPEYDEPSKEKA